MNWCNGGVELHPETFKESEPNDDNDRGRITLGYYPGNPGHMGIGIQAFQNGPVEYFHNNGRLGTRQQFVNLSSLEMDAYLDAGMQFEGKSIPASKAQLTRVTAELIKSQSAAVPQMYDLRSNSCVTPCTELIREVGFNPPNATSKHPRYLFEWFKTQPDL